MQELQKVCKDYNITALYAFGSRAAEALRVLEEDACLLNPSANDLDIGILTQEPRSIEDKVNLTLDLEKVFHTVHVDLCVLQEVDAFLAANIIRGERLYTADSYFVDEYELFVLRRAGDLAELERERMAMILQQG